ncbi:hypothetical protein OAU52_00215 [bacterium]|nr:hypothetical protein [bacterium]
MTTGCNSKDKSLNTPKAPFVSENTLRQLEEIEDSITWVPFLLNFPSIPDTNNPNLGYTYTDSGQGGGSQVKHLKGDSLKAQTHCFNFKLNQFKYAYYPFVGWGQDLPLHFSSIKGRFKYLSYSYKGALHSFMPRLSSVKDYGNFQGVAPSTSQWTQVVSKLDQTAQPTFAQKVTWEAKKLYALDWFIQGSDGEVGDLCISNIKFGYFN